MKSLGPVIVITFAGSLAANLPAMAQSQKPIAPPMSSGRMAVASMSTQDFVGKVKGGSQFELQMARLALQKTQNAAVRQFAERIVADHTMVSDDLNKAVASEPRARLLKVTPMPARMALELKQLQSASGKDFDRRFLRIMADEHREDINLLRSYQANGSDPAMKALARRALPALLADGAYAGSPAVKGRCCGKQMRVNSANFMIPGSQ